MTVWYLTASNLVKIKVVLGFVSGKYECNSNYGDVVEIQGIPGTQY